MILHKIVKIILKLFANFDFIHYYNIIRLSFFTHFNLFQGFILY